MWYIEAYYARWAGQERLRVTRNRIFSEGVWGRFFGENYINRTSKVLPVNSPITRFLVIVTWYSYALVLVQYTCDHTNWCAQDDVYNVSSFSHTFPKYETLALGKNLRFVQSVNSFGTCSTSRELRVKDVDTDTHIEHLQLLVGISRNWKVVDRVSGFETVTSPTNILFSYFSVGPSSVVPYLLGCFWIVIEVS